MWFWGQKKEPPPRVPSDTVLPFRFSDRQLRVSCDFHFFFDHVLDTEILRVSLDKLLTKPGWSNLGARLRNGVDGLEYHVPSHYSKARPAVVFTTKRHNMKIGQHPQLSTMPRCENSGIPNTAGFSAHDHRPWLRDPSTPEMIEGWLFNDIPQVAAHIISFDDATIITVTCLHTLSDAMGIGMMVDAWSKICNGEEDKVLPMVGFAGLDGDPLAYLYEGTPTKPFILSDRWVTGFGLFSFAARALFDLFWHPTTETRFTWIPGSFIDSLRTSARQQLVEESSQAMSGADQKPNLPFLSEGDVIFAWWARVIVKAFNPPPSQTVCLVNVTDSRGFLSQVAKVLPEKVAFLANSVIPVISLTRAKEFLDKNSLLGRLANHIRESLLVQRTDAQMVSLANMIKQTITKTGMSPVFGDPRMLRIVMSNWHRGRYFEIDFSGAVVGDSNGQKSGPDPAGGNPFFISTTWVNKDFRLRNFILVVGKNQEGDWLLMTRLRSSVWAKMDQAVSEVLSQSKAELLS